MISLKKIFYGFSFIFIIIVLIFFTIYMVFNYKPSAPKFSIGAVDIIQLQLSGTILSTTIKIDLVFKNPNSNFSINYDQFHIYATFDNYKVTNESTIPPFNQGEGATDMVNSTIIGNGIIVDPSISNALSQAQTYGSLSLTILANAQIRWGVLDWMSAPHNIQVTCNAMVYFQNGVPVKDPNLTILQECKTVMH